jgi:hypothetical protein
LFEGGEVVTNLPLRIPEGQQQKDSGDRLHGGRISASGYLTTGFDPRIRARSRASRTVWRRRRVRRP